MEFNDLTQGQKDAFTAAVEAIKSHTHLTINGPAGTGKTTLTRFLIDHLIRTGEKGIILAAPTHQAKKVLSKLAGMDANTIHSILKINPTTYEDNTTFEQKDVPDLSDCRVLICDEASMYDKELFRILMASVPRWCSVIALGDIAQIRPVEPGSSVPQLSLFFNHKDFKQVSLTEVMRSNAPIIEVATDIRNGKWIYGKTVDDQGVHDLNCSNSVQAFMTKYFDVVKTPEDLFETRMLAYTNKSVDTLNKIIRKRIYNTTEPFIKGEVLVMQEPLIKEYRFEGKSLSEVLFNNGEMVEVMSVRETSDMFKLKGVPGSVLIRYWQLDLKALDSEVTGEIKTIVDESELNKLQLLLGKAADAYKSGTVKAEWRSFWALRRAFHKIKPLPCSTIHKSQGVSVDNVFLYTPCIHKADTQLAQQLLYVGTTRARHNVYYI